MNLEPTMLLRGGKIIPELDLKGDIEFKNVTFAYPTRHQQVTYKKFKFIPFNKNLFVSSTF